MRHDNNDALVPWKSLKQKMERGITAYFIANYCTVTVPTKKGCRVQKYV
jgi:hypothetical protein